jgi:hypothetical protein
VPPSSDSRSKASLRERKKVKTRAAGSRPALRLFRERDYEAGAGVLDRRVDGRPAFGTTRCIAEGAPLARRNGTEVHNTL